MKILLSLSVSGTLILLLILGLQRLLRNRFSRHWQYYIWLIAALRFIIPFTPDITIEGNLLKKIDAAVTVNDPPSNLNAPIAVNTNSNSSEHVPESNNSTTPDANAPFNIYVYLSFVWAAGAVILFVRKATIYQGFVRYVKAGNSEVSDIDTLNLLSDCEDKLNIKTRVELYRNPLIASPMMFGFFRPRIVLPVVKFENTELSYVFMHELTHFRRKDMFYKWLIQIIVCIHWFNPFVYLLEKEVNKACELSCDEAVMSMLDDKSRSAYGDMLLSLVKPNPQYNKGSLASFTLTEGAKQLKERLGAILKFKKETKAARIMTGVLTSCVIVGAVFIGGYPASAAESKASESIKNGTKNTYVYNESQKSDWYFKDENFDWDWDEKDDFDWDWDEKDDFDWDWDENDDFDWDWDEKALMEQYSSLGIEKNGKSYYFKGKPVKVFLDKRPDSSFYNLEINKDGTVNIKIVRDSDNKITGVSYMTEQEAAEFLTES